MDKARAQFARWPYLHFPKAEQRWLRHFVEFAQEDAKGMPLAQWVRSAYTPERLRDWLAAHGRGDTFKAIFEKPAPANRWQCEAARAGARRGPVARIFPGGAKASGRCSRTWRRASRRRRSTSR